MLVAVLAPGPAEVDEGERRGVAVGEAWRSSSPSASATIGGPDAGLAVDLGPPVRAADLVAPALAFLGVGVDAVLAAGGDAGHPEQGAVAPPGRRQVGVAPLAAVGAAAPAGAGCR